MDHLVPASVADALRSAGLSPTGPFVRGERRPRWAALDEDGDRWVVTEVEPRHAGEARARARRLAGVRHTALGAVGPVVDLPEGGVLLLGSAPPGTDLGTLLAARGALEDAEVVGLLAPVAEALAAMHAAGVVHGGPGDADVVLTDDGPVLVDRAGRGGATGSAAGTRGGDIAALAALGLRALGAGRDGFEGTDRADGERGLDGPDRVGSVAAVCAVPPSDAASLAAALRDAAPAALPVLPAPEVLASLALRRLAGGGPGGPGRARGRHRAGRPLGRRIGLAVAAAVAALAVAGAVHGPPGRAVGDHPSEAASGHDGEAGAAESVPGDVGGSRPTWEGLPSTWQADAREAAERLTVARVRAQSERSERDLLAVSEPGSPVALLDAEAVRSWAAGGAGGDPGPSALGVPHIVVGTPTLLGCAPALVCVPVRMSVRVDGGESATSSVTLGLRPGTWLVVQVSGQRGSG